MDLTWIQPILDWLGDEKTNRALVLIGGGITGIAAMVGALWTLHRARRKPTPATPSSPTISIKGGSTAPIAQVSDAAGPVIINQQQGASTEEIAAIVDKLTRDHARELSSLESQLQEKESLNQQLTAAINETAARRDEPGFEKAFEALKAGDTSAAEALFSKLLESNREKGIAASKEAARAARNLGALAFLHDTETALRAYQEAAQLGPNDAVSWNRLGHLLRRKGALAGSEQAYERVLALGNESGDPELIAVATGNLGLIYKTRGDLDQAETYHKRALAIDEELGRKEGMASNYGGLGEIYKIRGDLDQAETYHKRALAIDEELGRKEGMATNYGNLGLICRARDDLDQAETYHKRALAIDEELGRKEGMAGNYGGLGLIYQTRDDLDQAETYHKRALAIDEELGRKEGMAANYGNLGLIYQTRGDLDQAETYHKRALAIDEELSRKEGMATNYGNLGRIALDRGSNAEACRLWRKARGLFAEVGAQGKVQLVNGWLSEHKCPNAGIA